MDSSEVVLGETSGPVTTYVDPDEVAALAYALDDLNPRYLEGSAVPPTYAVVPALEVMRPLSAFVLGDEVGVKSLVHAEHDLRILSPIVPGSSVRSTAERIGADPDLGGHGGGEPDPGRRRRWRAPGRAALDLHAGRRGDGGAEGRGATRGPEGRPHTGGSSRRRSPPPETRPSATPERRATASPCT